MNSTIKSAARVTEGLNQSNKNSDTNKEGIQHIKSRLGDSLIKKLESIVMHDQYIRSMDRQLIIKEDTLPRLLWGDLKGESVSEVIAT